MNQEELEEVTNILINSIESSNLSLYLKVELMINLRTFLSNYENNIKLLKKLETIKKIK